jgi:hypothetical protein
MKLARRSPGLTEVQPHAPIVRLFRHAAARQGNHCDDEPVSGQPAQAA